MNLPRPHLRRSTTSASLAVILLPVALVFAGGEGVPAQQPTPDDLPAAATVMAARFGTADARLNVCRSQHEACLLAVETAAAKLYMVQTIVAPEPEATPQP